VVKFHFANSETRRKFFSSKMPITKSGGLDPSSPFPMTVVLATIGAYGKWVSTIASLLVDI